MGLTCDLGIKIKIDYSVLKLFQVSCSQLTEESHVSEKLSEELREVVETLSLLLNCRKEETKPGYWTRVSNKINKAFFVFYVIAVTLFLIYMLVCWNTE